MPNSYRDLPKTELHLHLEGSVEPQTLCELDPSLTLAEVRARYEYADFLGFIQSYKWLIEHLNRPEDYALIARRTLARLASENVRYAEITISAGLVLWRGQEFAPIYEALQAEAAASAVEVRWILDATRQWGVEHAWAVARLAAERVERGVIAFGIGGDEVAGPVEWFGDVFRFVLDAGLHLTVHAGESAGPESVWGAVRLGAERIGHGIRAADDPKLLDHLRERDIPLEVCISSNVATRVVRCLDEHPVRRIYDAGVPMVLASDDPAMFHTTLTREYELAAREFGFTDAELAGIVENGFRYAFDREAGGLWHVAR
ncbi:MAG TPA: adenosine deaminase [Bryobacteraceae bacterium]|nr:adenosine deaminase [Bryobacteraceae bacterium]